VNGCDYASACVRVCVYVRARERERERVHVTVILCMSVGLWIGVCLKACDCMFLGVGV
jgi:hypothetical protein